MKIIFLSSKGKFLWEKFTYSKISELKNEFEKRRIIVGNAVIFGDNCKIGDGCIIRNGATILSYAEIGNNCFIGADALITGGQWVKENSIVN